jgi:hypothetical protein
MRKGMKTGLAEYSFGVFCLLAGGTMLHAQQTAHGSRPGFPWACLYFAPAESDDSADPDDPEEKRLSASADEVYRLWCTPAPSSRQVREQAADAMAAQWKTLWYRDNPFNAAFHETGSFGLLVLMGITHRVPKPFRLRREVLDHLSGQADAKPVLTMLKNAKLYPVN